MNNTSENDTFDVLKHGLSEYLPIRVVIRNNDGKIQGLCEDSFSLSCSGHRVRIWWSGKAYSFLGEHIINGIEDAERNAGPEDIIIDPLSNESLITVDWEKWMNATTKYDKRNAPYTVKGIK